MIPIRDSIKTALNGRDMDKYKINFIFYLKNI
jgi:hypothetical protein